MMYKKYGNYPIDLGLVCENVDCDEMMFYMYLQLKQSNSNELFIEHRLRKYQPILDLVKNDLGDDKWFSSNIFITAKTLYVNKNSMGQRPGWHCDGFMTDDINYIWYTDVPTEFCIPCDLTTLTQDHIKSMDEMDEVSKHSSIQTYSNRHLLRLDQSVIHRTNFNTTFDGVRTFVKISVSDKLYTLKGNSVNENIDSSFTSKRSVDRNCPIGNNSKINL